MILDSLWQDYILERQSKMQNEEREILLRIMSIEEKLTDKTPDEQLKLIEMLKDTLYEMSAQLEQKAFKSGVTFATAYLLDIISYKREF